ncbi:methyl-accepting chemotaxis protein [Brevibacillus invocatus]|uniref:Methyl-accepting chemotaxis protein n=2 Tax=Brevibacillus invocatus TaxID=173959 RepID=A0A3M8CFY2_9BACL|nr:methyl-accepting chemotaxis protein [Brevibacillus invocatus]
MARDVQASQVSLSCKNPDNPLEHYGLTSHQVGKKDQKQSVLVFLFLYTFLSTAGLHGLSWNDLKKGVKLPINVYRGRFNEILLREIEGKRYQLFFSLFGIVSKFQLCFKPLTAISYRESWCTTRVTHLSVWVVRYLPNGIGVFSVSKSKSKFLSSILYDRRCASMKWFYHISISKKLILVFTAVCLFMGGIGFLGYISLNRINEDMKGMYQDRLLPVIQLSTLNKAISENTVLLMNAASLNQDYDKLEQAVNENIAKINTGLTTYAELPLSQEEHDVLGTLTTLSFAYQNSITEALKLLKNNDSMGLIMKLNGTATQKTAIEERITMLVELQDKQAQELYFQSLERFTQSRNLTMILIGAGILLSLIFGILLTRMIANPINEVKKHLVEMANAGGDLTQRLQVKSRDEVGQLSHEFNSMLASIQGIIKEVLKDSRLVAETSHELAEKAQQTSRSSEEIVLAVQQIASGAETQVESISETSASMTQMSSGIQQISASTQEVTSSANLAREVAENGRKTIDESIQKMESVTTNVLQASNMIKHLNESSQAIGTVINVISGIAAQTNLLSLNAGIEAARASEHGRGFAVVASEIRKLAEESHQAAEQIAVMIKQIQEETNKVSAFMIAETKNVQAGLEAAEEARQAFQQIHASIETVTRQMTEVSVATVQMSAGTEEVLTSVGTVVQVAEDASNQTHQAQVAAENSREVMEQMAESISSMAEISQRLQSLVVQFKV